MSALTMWQISSSVWCVAFICSQIVLVRRTRDLHQVIAKYQEIADGYVNLLRTRRL